MKKRKKISTAQRSEKINAITSAGTSNKFVAIRNTPSLLLQTLIEPELRGAMAEADLESLPMYPEDRACRRPTTRRVTDVMESLSRHRLTKSDDATEDLYTDPTPIQRQLMKLLGNSPASYGRSH